MATALVLSMAVLTTCGDDETSSASAGARSAANAYVAAIADGRSADVCAALSTAARAELTHGRSGCGKAARRQLSPGLVKGVSVQKVEVDGDTATVTLRSPGSDSGGFDVIRMVREHGGWKVRDL